MSGRHTPEPSEPQLLKGDQATNLYFALRRCANDGSLIALSPAASGHPHQVGIQFRTVQEAEFFQQEWEEMHFPFVGVQGIQELVVAIGAQYVAVDKAKGNSFHLAIGHGGYSADDGQVVRQAFTQDIQIPGPAWQRRTDYTPSHKPRVLPPDDKPQMVRPAPQGKKVILPRPRGT